MSEANEWTRLFRARTSRRRLLQTSAVAGSLAGATVLAACGNKKPAASSGAPSAAPGAAGAQGTPKPGGTFNGAVSYNPTLDPQKASASPQLMVSGVYSRLFRFQTSTDPKTLYNHDLENDLAVSAETPDGVTWTIKLRPDAKFANIAPVNGHAVESDDVKATFARALDPSTPNPNRGSLGMIDPAQITTPDKQTAVFKLKYPYAPFNKTLASPAYSWILAREAYAGTYDPGKVVIGSGPFLVDTFTPDVAYTYKKNPDWFDKPRPYVDEMKFAVIPDANAQLAQFTAGNLDLITFTIDYLNAAKQQNPKATLIQTQNVIGWPTFWQMGDPTSAFQDIRVRRGMSMAIDRDAIGKAIYSGQYAEPVFLPLYLGKWASLISDLSAETQQYYKYNVAESKKLLQAAGVADTPWTYVYVGTGPFSSPAYVKQAQTISAMLNQSGVKNTLLPIDYNKDYIDSGKGSSQGYYPKDWLVYGGMSVYTEADEYLFGYWDSQSTNSHEHYSDPKMDAMIAKERTLLDENQRLSAVHAMSQYIGDQVLMLTSVGGYSYGMAQPRVQNLCWSDSLGAHTEMEAKLWLAS